MKRTTVSIVFLACFVVVLLIVSAFAAASSVNAQLGNTGIPVKCTGHAVLNTLGELICHAADGTLFANSARQVPSNRYFLETDVTIFPYGASYGYWQVFLGKYSAAGMLDSITMATRTQTTFSEHYGAPALVLSQGDFLAAAASGNSSGNADVYDYGLLTTSMNYLPLLTRYKPIHSRRISRALCCNWTDCQGRSGSRLVRHFHPWRLLPPGRWSAGQASQHCLGAIAYGFGLAPFSLLTPPCASWSDQSQLLLRGLGERYLKRGEWRSRCVLIDHLLGSCDQYNGLLVCPIVWPWTRRNMRQWLEPKTVELEYFSNTLLADGHGLLAAQTAVSDGRALSARRVLPAE